MDGVGKHLFLGSVFSVNQYGEIVKGKASGIGEDTVPLLRSSDDILESASLPFNKRRTVFYVFAFLFFYRRSRPAGKQADRVMIWKEQFHYA